MLFIASTALAVPREEVLDNAAQYALHTWTMTSVNETASCDSDYVSDYSAGSYTGLPYDWGGYMSLDEFDAEIAEGYGAGGHSWYGSLWCTAGVDCSGYVSMVWETDHNSTSTIPDIATQVSWGSIERADAIDDAGSHVVLFTHYTDDGTPVYFESCGSYGVRINNSGGWSYVDGYVPYRFDDIEDGTSTGTTSNPRTISSFPYTDYWFTPGSTSDAVDSYSCKPEADESGPEVWYRFDTSVPGTVTAVVSDSDSVDIDVHVLTSPDGDACLDRDDTEVDTHVDAGTVWLSLDSYVGSREYSGPYVLTVDFTPDAGSDPGDGGGGGGSSGSTDTGGGTPDDGDTDTNPAPPSALHLPGTLSPFPTGCASTPGVTGLGAILAGLLAARRRR